MNPRQTPPAPAPDPAPVEYADVPSQEALDALGPADLAELNRRVKITQGRRVASRDLALVEGIQAMMGTPAPILAER